MAQTETSTPTRKFKIFAIWAIACVVLYFLNTGMEDYYRLKYAGLSGAFRAVADGTTCKVIRAATDWVHYIFEVTIIGSFVTCIIWVISLFETPPSAKPKTEA